jgi:hypothetical protein
VRFEVPDLDGLGGVEGIPWALVPGVWMAAELELDGLLSLAGFSSKDTFGTGAACDPKPGFLGVCGGRVRSLPVESTPM